MGIHRDPFTECTQSLRSWNFTPITEVDTS